MELAVIKKYFALLVAMFWLSASSASADQALTADDFKQLKPQRVAEYFYAERYGPGNMGLETTLAYQFNYFLSDHWLLGAMVSGAALGNRSGYGTASLGLGRVQAIACNLDGICQAYLGAGGGHGLPTGGGLVLNLCGGLRWALIDHVGLGINVGVLNFISGDFVLSYINLGIFNNFNILSLP